MIRIRIGVPETKKGSNVVLIKDGKILLLLRSEKSTWKPGLWGPPGGHVDSGETSVQAAARETFEESGLMVRPRDLKPLLQRTRHDFGMVYFYITDKFTGEDVKLSWEHNDFVWVDMKRIDELDITFQPDELDIIKKAVLSY